MRRAVITLTMAAVCATTLAGCFLLPVNLPVPAPDRTPTNGPADDAPAGWSDLQPCDDSDHWIWVDGYPAEQLEAAGFEAECGGTYFDPDLPTYTSSADSTVTEEQLDEIRAQLEDVGWTETDSTFESPEPGDDPGLAGSWQYDLDGPDGHETIYIVNLWNGQQPVQFQTFVDYESPATRDLSL